MNYELNHVTDMSIASSEVETDSNLIKNKLLENFDFHVLTEPAKKKKWLTKFRSVYLGFIKPNSKSINDNNSKYIVVTHKEKEIGFLLIQNITTNSISESSRQAWNVCGAYVHLRYRNQGVFYKMLENAISEHNVVSMFIETDRYTRLTQYYQSLGFTTPLHIPEINHTRLFLSDYADTLGLSSYTNINEDDR